VANGRSRQQFLVAKYESRTGMSSLLMCAALVLVTSHMDVSQDARNVERGLAMLRELVQSLSQRGSSVASLRAHWGRQTEDAPNGRRYQLANSPFADVFVAADAIGTPSEHIRYVKLYAANTSDLKLHDFERVFGNWQDATPNPDGNPFDVQFTFDDVSAPREVDIHIELSGPPESPTTKTISVSLFPNEKL
jgi:hypothetical protein